MLWKRNGITTAPQLGLAARSPQKGDTRGIKKKSHLILSFLLHLKASLECLFILSSWKACFPNRNSAPVLQCLSQRQEPSTLQSTHLPSCAHENETVYFIYWDTSLQHLSIRLDTQTGQAQFSDRFKAVGMGAYNTYLYCCCQGRMQVPEKAPKKEFLLLILIKKYFFVFWCSHKIP